MIKVLLVEDEPTLACIIRDTLSEQGFSVRMACDGEEALPLIDASCLDVIVADVMMPRMDGFEMLKRMRRNGNQTPVLLLTARSAVSDVVEGFELGANDYLRKPFSMQELIVRIKALAGRAHVAADKTAGRQHSEQIRIGDYLFAPLPQTLTHADGTTVELSHRESEILHRLCSDTGRVVETRSLLIELWGNDNYFNTRSLHVFITKLRHHLRRDSSIRIINVRGIGYKMVCPPSIPLF